MSTPFIAWLRRASLAGACGACVTALGQAPQPFTPPLNLVQLPGTVATSGPPTGQATVSFRMPATGQWPVRPAASAGSVPASATIPQGAQTAQQAYYQVAPGQAQPGIQQTALVQRYDQFVQQLPPGPKRPPAPTQIVPQYPLERDAQVVPVSLQGDRTPAPIQVDTNPAAGAMQPLGVDTAAAPAHGTVREPIVEHADALACDRCGGHGKSCRCQSGPSGFFWVRGDYLLWWTKGSPLPPLITSSPDTTPIAQTGVLGQPGTTILFGNNDVNDDDRSGYRFRAGYWFDCCMCSGIEAEYLQLDTATTSTNAFCTPDTALARPFFNVQTGQQDAELVCYPGVVNGGAFVNTDSDFQSGGIRFLRNICHRDWCIPADNCGNRAVQGGYRLNWLAGYRYLRLDEGVHINEMLVSTNTGGVIAVGTTFDVTDDFQTDSEFHGGELGLMAQWRRGRWTLDALGKAALGNVQTTVRINGSTTTDVPNGPTTTNQGGLLAQATNIGTYENDDFSIVPEASLNLGYNITPRLRALVGYTFIYWTNVARPGDQIDLSLNPSQFPPGTLTGDARPAFTLNDSDFWAQGLNVGAEYRF